MILARSFSIFPILFIGFVALHFYTMLTVGMGLDDGTELIVYFYLSVFFACCFMTT